MKPGRGRWSRRLLLALSAAGVLGAGAVVLYVQSGPRLDAWAGARLRGALAKALGRPVSLGSIHVSPFAGLVVASDVVVGEVPPATGRVLEVRRLSAVLRIRSLLRGRLDIVSLRMEGPRVSFSRRDRGWEGPFPALARAAAPGSSAQRGGASSLKIVLRQFEVSEGLLTFEDRAVPFWCRAEDVTMNWLADRNGKGRGMLQSEHLRGGSAALGEAGRLQVEAQFDGARATVSATASLGPSALSIQGSGALAARKDERPTAEVRCSLHLEGSGGAILSSSLGLHEPLKGSLEAHGILRLARGEWSVDGRLQGKDLRYTDLAAASLSTDLHGDSRGIELRKAQLAMFGGFIEGDVHVDPRRGGSVRASARAHDLAAAEILRLVGLSSPLEGLAAASGSLSGRLGQPDSLELRASVRVSPASQPDPAASARPSSASGGSGRYGLSGEGLVEIHGRRLSVTSERVQAGATSTTLRLEKDLAQPTLRLVLAAESASLCDSSLLLRGFLTRQRHSMDLPWESARIEGSGSLSGDFTFDEDAPARGTTAFTFHGFSYDGIGHAETVSGTGGADGASFSLEVTKAAKSGGFLTLKGSFPEGRSAPSRLSAKLERWPVDDVLARLGAPAGASARASGPIGLRFGEEPSAGETELQLSEARLGDAAFDHGSFAAALRGATVDVTRLSVAGARARAEASGSYDFGSRSLSASVSATQVDAALAHSALHDLPLAGHADVDLTIETRGQGASWHARFVPAEDLTFEGRPITAVTLSAEGDQDAARFQGTFGELADFSGTLALAPPHASAGRIALRDVPLAPLFAMARPDLEVQLGGEMGGTIAWSGPLDDTGALRAQATFDQLRLALGPESFESLKPARLSLEGRAVRFDDVVLTAEASHLTIHGLYPLDAAGALDVETEAEIDLGAIGAFFPELTASGSLRGTLRATGSKAQPTLAGSLALDDGRLRVIGFPLTADRIHLRARIDSGRITADTITAIMGGGEFAGKGRVELDGMAPAGFRLEGRVTNVSLSLPEGFFRGQYSGSLAWELKKGDTAPTLTGNLDLLRGLWRRDFQLDRFSFGGRAREPIFQVSSPDEGVLRTALDLKIRADDNVWCHNDLADVEGRADLQLSGTIGRAQLTGRFEGFEGGEMRFRRVRYVIDQASVDFPAGPILNPEFDVGAQTRVREYDVRMHLFGNFDRIAYELTSNPPLPEPQILALLLTGSANEEETAGALANGGQPGSAASVVGGELGALVGQRLERWLGFEEIRIEPILTQGPTADPTTWVTLGKRLSPRIFVKTSVPLNSPEEPIYQVEYALNRSIRLLLEQGELGSFGGDVRYSARFFSPFARAAASAPAPSRKKKKRIVDVSFLGDPEATPDNLRRTARLRTGAEFSRRAMVEGADRLRKRYVSESYLEALVRSSAREREDGGVMVAYEIERGPKLELRIEGAGASTRRIRQAIDGLLLEPGFGGDVATDAEDRIQKVLRDDGYYACYVRTASERKGDTEILTFRVDTGERVLVQSVRIQGNVSLSEEEISKQILTGKQILLQRDALRPETLAADTAAIENLYRSRGFLKARARSEVSLSPDGRRGLVSILVSEGPSSRLRKVELSGEHALSKERIRPLIQSRPGESFLPVTVVSDRETIARFYDAEGYPEAHVEEQVASDGDAVDLTFQIKEGERRTVGAIAVEGNDLTDKAVVMRDIPMQPGEPLSNAKMRETRQKLMRTGLFSDVQVSYAEPPDGSPGQLVKVKVREAENLVLGLGAGYNTEFGPRGSIVFANTNLWGRGEYAGVSAVYGGKLRRAQVTFKEPRLLAFLWGATLSAFYEKRERESFSQRQLGSSLLLERRSGGPISHFLRYSVNISEVFDLRVPIETFQQENFKIPLERLRLANLGYSIVRDTRNDPLAATHGLYASGDVRAFAKPLGSEKRFSKIFLQGSAYHRLPLGLNWSSSVRLGLGWRGMSEPIPLQERYFAGGDSTVRGFGLDRLGFVETEVIRQRRDTDNDGTFDTTVKTVVDNGSLEHETLRPLGGESLLIVNNELRHKIVGSLSGTAFLDAGNVYPHATDITAGHLRYAAGLGLRFDTAVGPLRLEYGRKLNRIAGESGGEIVLSLGQSF